MILIVLCCGVFLYCMHLYMYVRFHKFCLFVCFDVKVEILIDLILSEETYKALPVNIKSRSSYVILEVKYSVF